MSSVYKKSSSDDLFGTASFGGGGGGGGGGGPGYGGANPSTAYGSGGFLGAGAHQDSQEVSVDFNNSGSSIDEVATAVGIGASIAGGGISGAIGIGASVVGYGSSF